MKTVSVHIPCLVDTFMPETGRSVIRLLERLNIPHAYHLDQTCCGLPSFNAGFVPETRKMARHFLRIFGKDEVVVSPSGSCVSMIRTHYPALLADEPEWTRLAEELAGRVFELTEYLVDVLGREEVGGRFEGKVAYHDSCQLMRNLGVSEQPRKLIRALEGVELVEMENADVCCGFGGEFAHAYHEISEQMAADKANAFLKSGADVLTMGDPGCCLNLKGYMSRHHPGKQVLHIAELLAGPA